MPNLKCLRKVKTAKFLGENLVSKIWENGQRNDQVWIIITYCLLETLRNN